jgi:hypothetical protein
MPDRYQEELRRQEQEQRKLEETMQRHPQTQEHDDQLKIQLEWLNKQK